MTDIRVKIRDGKEQIQLKCPSCRVWGDVDKDQAEGIVSCNCPECGHHFMADTDNEVKIDVNA